MRVLPANDPPPSDAAVSAAVSAASASLRTPHEQETDPQVEILVHDILGQVAAKWTMIILEALDANGTLRFSQLGRKVDGISQKMLTQTLRNMERDGLVLRLVHPVIPPHVECSLTALGKGLSAAFCGVWKWAEAHHADVQKARQSFAAKA